LTIYTGIWLINVMLLMETRPSIGRREARGPVSVVFRLMFLVFLLHGLAALAFPSTILSVLVSVAFFTDFKGICKLTEFNISIQQGDSGEH
jgi:hypothetical protein